MKSIKALMIVALLVALPALLASNVGAQTPPTLDHFKCWTVVEGRPANDFVLLHDQFNAEKEQEPALVRSPIFFCNPTVKTLSTGAVTPIVHPDHHLKMYLIATHPEPTTRTVTISNQFNSATAVQTLTVFQPVILAVPTQKDPHAEPQGLNHFKCYLAKGEPINTPVALQDQFDKQKREVVRVLRPVLFCNPVEKDHDGVITPIIPSTANDKDHLTCYVFTPSTLKVTGVRTRNQFGEERLLATRSRFLCVPSQKLDFRTP